MNKAIIAAIGAVAVVSCGPPRDKAESESAASVASAGNHPGPGDTQTTVTEQMVRSLAIDIAPLDSYDVTVNGQTVSRRIRSSFEVKVLSPSPSLNPSLPDNRKIAIRSLGRGGACLAADFKEYGIGGQGCSVRTDCDDELAKFKQDFQQPEAFAYCAAPSGETNQCWIKPGPSVDYCNGSMVDAKLDPLPVNEKISLPEVEIRGALPVRWMLQACLNEFDATALADTTACGSDTDTRKMTWSSEALAVTSP